MIDSLQHLRSATRGLARTPLVAAVRLALVASLGPTLRAATTDPAIVLREP